MKLTKSEYEVLSDVIVRSSGDCYNGKNECAGILSFENSRNCSQANTIYKYCNIQDESKFRKFLIDWIWEYKVAINNNATIITGKLTKPEYKVGYDNLKSILSKFYEWSWFNNNN